MKKIFLRGGVLLTLSAIASKFLGLLRDRLFLDVFGDTGSVDLIFASFRIPDFFFFLLVGGTVSTLFLPRVAGLNSEQEKKFFSSFLWGVVILFGALCGIGIITAPYLVQLFAAGFEPSLQTQMVPLSRILFGSVYLLAVSSVFAAYHQSKERFWSLALAPLLYTGMICLMVFVFEDRWGLQTIGFGALAGAFLHVLLNACAYCMQQKGILFSWKQPVHSWKYFGKDFVYRVTNTASFQLNQSADVLIASFLMTGTVTAFMLGTNLALAPLTVFGYSLANAVFPRLTKAKQNADIQKKIILRALKQLGLIILPGTIFALIFSDWLLSLIYGLEGLDLQQTKIVFLWTVVSLPFACMIPLLSRTFLANDDVKTPLRITVIALTIATCLAAILSLFVFSGTDAILGLAIGNCTANVLSASLFAVMLSRKFRKKEKQNK